MTGPSLLRSRLRRAMGRLRSRVRALPARSALRIDVHHFTSDTEASPVPGLATGTVSPSARAVEEIMVLTRIRDE